MAIKMNYFTNQEVYLDGDKTHNRNYECFGWWLPDLLSDAINPPIGVPEILKSQEYDSGVSFEKSQLVSDESLTSGSQWDKADTNLKVEEENIIQEQILREESINQKKLNEKHIDFATSEEKSNMRNGDLETMSYYEKQEKTIMSREQMLAFINLNLPNIIHPEKKLKNVQTSNLQSGSPTHPKNNKAKNSRMKSHKRVGLEELVLTVEHDATDIDLEESRVTFLRAASVLDSRLTALEMDSQQLHNDLSNIHRDFQIQEDAVTRMTQDAHRLVSDFQNLRYLDDLIFLLQGQLDRITLQNWPFVLAHVLPQKDSTQELNLVV